MQSLKKIHAWTPFYLSRHSGQHLFLKIKCFDKYKKIKLTNIILFSNQANVLL